MARRTYPRPARRHAVVASHVLTRYEQAVGAPLALPIPIELIIEQIYELEILWDEITEPPGTVILGALAPRDRRILLNSRHEALFERWIGPERFTLAHELAHWIYDAEDPNQLALDFDAQSEELYCYRRESPGLPESARIREVNANNLAAHLLLPEGLVRAGMDDVRRDLRGTAARWGVSRTTLRIRLENLGLINEDDAGQPTLT